MTINSFILEIIDAYIAFENYHLSSAVYWVFRRDIIICRFTIINTVLLALIPYHVSNAKRKQTAIARLKKRAILRPICLKSNEYLSTMEKIRIGSESLRIAT